MGSIPDSTISGGLPLR